MSLTRATFTVRTILTSLMTVNLNPFDLGRPGGQGQISEAFKESLVIPKSIVGTKKKTKGPSTMAPHNSGDEVIQLMEEKLEKTKCDEDLKKKCWEERKKKSKE